MSYAVQQKVSADGFVKPGELIDLRDGATLSLQDRRIFNALVEHAWPTILEDKRHIIPTSRLRGLRHKSGERVEPSLDKLMTTLVKVPAVINGHAAITSTQLLGPTTRVIDEGSPQSVVRYSFPLELRQIIQDSRYWGRVKAYIVFNFSSKYALALYEAVCLRANLKVSEQRFTLEAFRDLIGVEDGKLPLFKNLKKWAIDPAVLEVNGLSDFNVTITPERDGASQRGHLKGFLLHWEKKTPEQWSEVLVELTRLKKDRAIRLRERAAIQAAA